MHIIILSVSGLFSILATSKLIVFAQKMNLCDAPGVRKVHKNATPLLGGVAVAIATWITLSIALAIWPELYHAVDRKLIVLLLASTVMLGMGLIDDCFGLPARIKLLVQLAVATLVCVEGIRIQQIGLGSNVLNLGILAWPITILWIVGLTNAVNLIDGMDGLATGITAIASAIIAIYSMTLGLPILAILLLALSGSLLGFLFFNFNPAKIFLGDAGTYFIGFVLASSSVLNIQTSGHFNGMGITLLVLGIPVCDTLFSMVRRVLQRRSIFSPDREHLHHRLLDKGLNPKQIALISYGVTGTLAILALLLCFTNTINTIIIMACGGLVLITFFRAAGAIHLRDSIKAFRQNLSISSAAGQEKKRFEAAQLRLRESSSFDNWWCNLCLTAEELGLVRMSLKSFTRSGEHHVFNWSSPLADPFAKTAKVSFPVRDRRGESQPRIYADFRINGSLEAAGRLAVLFGRLIDECGIEQLKSSESCQLEEICFQHVEPKLTNSKQHGHPVLKECVPQPEILEGAYVSESSQNEEKKYPIRLGG